MKFQSNANFKPTRDFDADDVVFSFQRMLDKTNPFYQSANGNFPEFIDLVAQTCNRSTRSTTTQLCSS